MPAQQAIYFADVFSSFLNIFNGRPWSNDFSGTT